MTSARALVFLVAILPAQAAFAAELALPAYSDDRSTPQALVKSLYNAVSRKEYARAWSYFSSPPSKNFDAFVKGYDGTAFVEAATGRPVIDGAAGSVFYKQPVAIQAVSESGEESIFAGCYTIRQVNAQIQEPPFQAMTIEKGALKPAGNGGWLINAVPEDCDGEKPEEETADAALERVRSIFLAAHTGDCNQRFDTRPFLEGREPQVFPLKFRYSGEGTDLPEREHTLYRFTCATYAYNVAEVYYLRDEYGDIRAVQFSEPVLAVNAEGETKKPLEIAGWKASQLLINSEFITESVTITSFSKWRGFGDAFSAGEWVFDKGEFRLKSWSVDADFDEKQEPVELVNFGGKN